MKAYSRGLVYKTEHIVLIRYIRKAALLVDPVFVEVGIASAITTKMILQLLRDMKVNARLVSVDIAKVAQRKWSAICENEELAPLVKRRFVLGGLEDAKIESSTVSWCFIDGCHCRDCARRDIANAMPLICDGGFLLMHDADPRNILSPPDQMYHGGPKRKIDVAGAIDDLSLEEAGFELVASVAGTKGERPGRQKFKKGLRRLPRSKRLMVAGGLRVYQKNSD